MAGPRSDELLTVLVVLMGCCDHLMAESGLIVTPDIDAQRQLQRFVDHPLILANLQYNAIQINPRIERIQWAILPFNDLFDDLIRNLRNQTGRDLGALHFLESLDDLPSG